METIIRQLKNSKDHLYISSQTGTGKTLALLCSLLGS
jgi:Rad3-related DNA helicase